MAHLDSIVHLVRFGFSEAEVLDMPVDRFTMYCQAAGRIHAGERRDTVTDLVSAIGGAITGKKIKEYVGKLDKASEGK